MAELRLSRSAARDLELIRTSGVERYGALAAARHLAGFERLFNLLRERPQAGAARPELGRQLRSLSHQPHRILYKVDQQSVLIVRILHQARDVPDALRGRP